MGLVTVARAPLVPALHLRGRLARSSGERRLLVFAAFLGLAGAAVWLGPLRDARQVTTIMSIPWWAELVACYVASLLYVELRVHRNVSTLSLTEIPIAVGLLLADPHQLLGCYVGGVLLANWTRQRVRPVKDYSNAMLDILSLGVTVLVFTAIGSVPRDPLALRSVIALTTAMVAGGCVVGPLALNIGSLLAQGSVTWADLRRACVFQVVATATNTCLGIVALMFIVSRPALLFALVPPAGLVLAGQIAAGESQRRADRNLFLYRTTEILHSSMVVGERTGELLTEITRMFCVQRAELVVLPEVRGPAVRFSTNGVVDGASVTTSELTLAEREILVMTRAHGMQSGDAGSAGPLGRVLAERNAAAGTVIALPDRMRPQGMLLLTDPTTGKTQLSAHDQNLLTTLAGMISVALENGQLADAIRDLSVERAELARRVFYDPLTQIANRSLFVETVGRALTNLPASRRPVGVLFIDLDGFKEINDTFGHAAGDQVLRAVAGRLRVEVRKLDLAARLGGDEFGLLLGGMRSPEDARVIARRINATLQEPIPLGDGAVTVGGSIGVAVVDDSSDTPPVEEMLRRADMAMYLAKRQGKNRFVIFDEDAREPVIATTPILHLRGAGR